MVIAVPQTAAHIQIFGFERVRAPANLHLMQFTLQPLVFRLEFSV